MAKKVLSCFGTPVQDDDPPSDIPEQIRIDLDAAGGLDAIARHLPPQPYLEEMCRIYKALSDPIRLSILYTIRDRPLCVCVINRFMKLSGSKLSYHLTGLKEAGLVEGENQGNWIIYSITERGQRLLKCTEHTRK